MVAVVFKRLLGGCCSLLKVFMRVMLMNWVAVHTFRTMKGQGAGHRSTLCL